MMVKQNYITTSQNFVTRTYVYARSESEYLNDIRTMNYREFNKKYHVHFKNNASFEGTLRRVKKYLPKSKIKRFQDLGKDIDQKYKQRKSFKRAKKIVQKPALKRVNVKNNQKKNRLSLKYFLYHRVFQPPILLSDAIFLIQGYQPLFSSKVNYLRKNSVRIVKFDLTMSVVTNSNQFTFYRMIITLSSKDFNNRFNKMISDLNSISSQPSQTYHVPTLTMRLGYDNRF